jgi:hypothetical protein
MAKPPVVLEIHGSQPCYVVSLNLCGGDVCVVRNVYIVMDCVYGDCVHSDRLCVYDGRPCHVVSLNRCGGDVCVVRIVCIVMDCVYVVGGRVHSDRLCVCVYSGDCVY